MSIILNLDTNGLDFGGDNVFVRKSFNYSIVDIGSSFNIFFKPFFSQNDHIFLDVLFSHGR